MTGGGVRELGACEGLGVLDEVCGLVDKPLDGVYRLAPAGVEAVAVEGALSSEVAVPKVAHLRIVLSELQEGAGGVGGLGGEFTGAGEDEGVGGALGGAPGLFGGVPDVSGGHALDGGAVHAAGVGEDGGGVG